MADINTEPADDNPETVTADEPTPVEATTTATEPSPVVATTTVPVTPELAGPVVRPNRRKVREGLVLSVAMDKTAVVGVVERVRHPRYAKTVQRTKAFYAHDPNNDLRVGDRVRIAETRPMSKLKRWRIIDVLERAK
jgi:small subunit ribosomal protein S17